MRLSSKNIKRIMAIGEPIIIPQILIERLKPFGARFLKVAKPEAGNAKSGKNPIEKGWQDHFYEATDESLQGHLQRGGNYGVSSGKGIIIIDTDDKETTEELNSFPTFTVQTGRGESGRHKYYLSDVTENGVISDKNGKNIGNVQAHEKMVVGPNSRHWSGGIYKIIDDSVITYISKAQLDKIFGKQLQWAHQRIEEEDIRAEQENSKAKIPINKVIDIMKFHLLHDSEWQGEHPVHGSTGGKNFNVNLEKNSWHCFRCNSGGGALSWIAVKNGIVECAEVHGLLEREKYLAALALAKEAGFDVQLRDETLNPDVERFFEKDAHGNPKFVPALVASELMKENIYVTLKTTLLTLRYNPENGVYEQKAEPHIRQEARRKLGKFLNINRHREIEHFIKSSTLKEMPTPPEDLIVVRNGVLNVKTGQLEPFNPNYFFLNALPVKYDPQADCLKFKVFLSEVVPRPESVMVLQEFTGYCLNRNCRFEKCLMLIGTGANGKSTFLNVLRAVLGKQNVTNLPLQILIVDRFALSELYGKLANICTELPPVALKEGGLFRNLVSGEGVSGQRKFIDRFDFIPYAKQLFACNTIPPAPDDTDAFFRRWLIETFPIQFLDDNPKTDPYLKDKLSTPEELSGVLNWALQGLKRLLTQGKFSASETVTETRAHYTLLSNPVKAFAETQLSAASDKFETKDAVHKACVQFCKDNNLPMIDKRVLSTKLPDYIACTDAMIKIQGRAVRVWKGIQIMRNPSLQGDADDHREVGLRSHSFSTAGNTGKEKEIQGVEENTLERNPPLESFEEGGESLEDDSQEGQSRSEDEEPNGGEIT